MNEINYNIDLFALFIFLGIGQGLYIFIILIFKNKNRTCANVFLSFFLLAISLILIDLFLCYTRLILNTIFLFAFSDSLIFIIGPLLYLYFKYLLNKSKAHIFPHFIPFILYFLYSFFYFIQSNEIKYNIYVYWYNLNLPIIETSSNISDDPLHIKRYYVLAAVTHLVFYFTWALGALIKFLRSNKQILISKNHQLRWIRDFLIVFFIGILVTAILKFTVIVCTVNYLIAIFLTIMIYFISFRFAFRPDIIIDNIKKNISPDKKYNKSSLSDEMKQVILIRIKKAMEEEKLYRDSLISLSKLSTKISASSNHISQVINECMNQNFYEMLASYRIKDAEELMKKFTNYTIDEISIMVGYNSRTAFNNAFKKKTGKTPSEYLIDLK